MWKGFENETANYLKQCPSIVPPRVLPAKQPPARQPQSRDPPTRQKRWPYGVFLRDGRPVSFPSPSLDPGASLWPTEIEEAGAQDVPMELE
jgi:hypothetical protein